MGQQDTNMANRATDDRQTKEIRRALKDDPTPKYYQIMRALEERICAGEFPLGSPIPTEHALCDTLGVSRITVRKALQLLHDDGIIERIRGRGSFVCKLPKPRPGSTRKTSLTEIGIVTQLSRLDFADETKGWELNITQSLEAHLLDYGYTLIPLTLPYGVASPEQEVIQRIDSLRQRLAGVIAFANAIGSQFIRDIDQRKLCWLTINAVGHQQTHNFVSADNFGGGRQVGQLLAASDYPKVMILGPVANASASNASKCSGFIHGFLEGGRKPAELDLFPTEGIVLAPTELAGLRKRLAARNRPHAIFCLGDILAADSLKIAAQLKLKVPDDLVVIGATGLSLAEHTSPPLTVLRQPMTGIGQTLATMMHQMIRSGQYQLPGIYLPTLLDKRQSCPLPPPA